MAVPMGQRYDDRRDDEYDQELVDWLDVIGKNIHMHIHPICIIF
jgi:hypothetical protein